MKDSQTGYLKDLQTETALHLGKPMDYLKVMPMEKLKDWMKGKPKEKLKVMPMEKLKDWMKGKPMER